MKRIGIFILFFLVPLLAKTQAEERIFVFPNYYLVEDTMVNPFDPVWQQGQKSQLVLVDSLFYYTWSSGTSAWANYQSIIQIYNEKGKLVRKTYRQPSLDSWNNTFYYEYSYDENDNLSIKTGIEWNSNSQRWDSSSLYQYTYDEINRLKQYIYHKWDTVLDSWANYAKYLYDYDLQGNWNYYERQDWDADSSEWKWNYRFLYTYEDGVKTEFVRQNWDQTVQEWVNNNQNTYEYNTSGNLVEETQFVWQIGSEEWVNSTLITYLYNDDGLVIENTYLTWSSNAWKNSVLYTYAYTDFGKESEIVYLLWDDSGAKWEENYRYLYGYDDNNNLNQEIWQEWSSGNWQNDFKVEYFLSTHTSPVYNIVPKAISQIFPNPFSEKTTIHFDPGNKVIWKIELLDITGKKVIQMDGLSANTVTLTRGTLKSGIYFLKISYFNKYLVRKVILR